MLRRIAGFTLMFLAANSIAAFAADAADTTVTVTPIKTAVARVAKDEAPTVNLQGFSRAAKRPTALGALYGTYGALQALDVMSTRRALASGAQEANPLMRGGNMATTIAIKAAAGASTIFFAERMWKKNRVGAVVVMAALNGASAAIVARNQRNARR